MPCGGGLHSQRHLLQGFFSVTDTLVYNIQWQLANMGLAVVFLLNIFDELLALWSTTLVKTWINGKFIGIDKLCHCHTQK